MRFLRVRAVDDVVTGNGLGSMPLPGYYCPPGTVSPAVCGNSSVYCPGGSASPTVATSGYYTVGSTPSVMSSQNICPAGSYCVAGVAISCPSGTFRDTAGGSKLSDCVVCPLGFYCRTCNRWCLCRRYEQCEGFPYYTNLRGLF